MKGKGKKPKKKKQEHKENRVKERKEGRRTPLLGQPERKISSKSTY